MTGLENFLVSNEGVGTLNGNGTQVPLMDSSYDNSSGKNTVLREG